MAYFSHIATHVGGTLTHLGGIADLESYEIGGQYFLFAASGVDGGMTSFQLSEGQAAVLVDQIGAGPNRGTYGLESIDITTINGQDILIPSGHFDDRTAFHSLDGGFDSVEILGADPTYIGGFTNTVTVEVAGKTFMLASQWQEDGFRSFRIRDDLSLEHKAKFLDGPDSYLGDVADMTSTVINGQTYVLMASAEDAGVNSYWIGQWGNIQLRDAWGPTDGTGFSVPTAVEAIEVDGMTYLLLAAAGTGSISVLRVNQYGDLFEEDYALDTLDTRFGGVTALTTFEVDGRAFVLAGGSDDGLSLFELAPGGTLVHLESIADTAATTLDNVLAIEAIVVGDEVQVFVTSENDAGITQFEIDLTALGDSLSGTDGADTLSAGASDDILMGYDGADVLNGGAGDDIIMDGAGVDVMTGGAGNDTFVFTADDRLDTVTDFTLGEDKLDLSDLDLIYFYQDLSITPQPYGAIIRFGDERIRLETADYMPLSMEDFSAEDFIF